SFSRFIHNPPPPSTLSTLSLHDALPILSVHRRRGAPEATGHHRCRRNGRVQAISQLPVPAARAAAGVLHRVQAVAVRLPRRQEQDRKSTRLNSSHVATSYAVFCLKKKNS